MPPLTFASFGNLSVFIEVLIESLPIPGDIARKISDLPINQTLSLHDVGVELMID